MRRVETSSKENKKYLTDLITHTTNVERAVTMNQQEMVRKKEAQAQKWVK